jgi:hypothetical protein
MSVVPDLSNLILGSFPIESPHLKSSMERALYSGSRQDRVTRFWAVLQRQKNAAQEIYMRDPYSSEERMKKNIQESQ